MSLNPEPADPQERQEHHLPPKSFADAVEEAPPLTNGNGHSQRNVPIRNGAPYFPNDDDSVNEDLIKETPPRSSHNRKGSEPRPLAEVLEEPSSRPSTPVRSRKPVEARPEADKSYADAASEGTNGNYKIEPIHTDAASEFVGQGMDESPRTPIVRKTHRRAGSRSSQGGKKRDSSSDEGPPKMVYEEFANKDGEHLTSVKPHAAFEQSNRTDEKVSDEKEKAKHARSSSRDELVSGRRAGAGWEKSAYEDMHPLQLPSNIDKFILQHTLGSSERPGSAPTPNLHGPRPHTLHRLVPRPFLPPLHNPSALAPTPALPHIRPLQ